jgi:hypothetical protein
MKHHMKRMLLALLLITLLSLPSFAVPEEILRCYLVEDILVCEYVRQPGKPKKPVPEFPRGGGEWVSPLPPSDSRDDLMLHSILRLILSFRLGWYGGR